MSNYKSFTSLHKVFCFSIFVLKFILSRRKLQLLMDLAQQVEDVFANVHEAVDKLLLLLSEKEKFVIVNRFDFSGKGRLTLDSIGKRFSVTRERVRQIEKNALTKLRRNVFNTSLVGIQDHVRSILQDAGGLLKEDILFAKMINDGDEGSFLNKSSTRLAIVLADDLYLIGNTIEFEPFVSFNSIPQDFVNGIASKAMKYLSKRNNVVMIEELHQAFTPELASAEMGKDLLRSIFSVSKEIKVLHDAIGLVKWRHINPKTLRDKIFFILRNEQKAMHFVDIANKITEHGFDTKQVNLQAVHNELIRYKQFVLIGRGIYALEEWGYDHGTTKDVIITLLKKKKVMSEVEIIKKVLEKRKVKPITITLSLKNNPEFIRVGRKRYQLAEVTK